MRHWALRSSSFQSLLLSLPFPMLRPHRGAVNEAALMDPQQRVLLEETVAAFRQVCALPF